MAYQSVDQLQKVLVEKVFHYAKDSKKAAGRALGTLVEIITFYMLKSWGFEHSVAIERSLPEFGNPAITHNVEYSLHPILRQKSLVFLHQLPINVKRILENVGAAFSLSGFTKSNRVLLTNGGVLRNSCVVANGENSHLVATLDKIENDSVKIEIVEQYGKPYAMFECKRVGVEEGMKKGPQSIEKAKQGAYVAKALSSLHKLRTPSGERRGLVYKGNGTIIYSKDFFELMAEIIASDDTELLRDFVLTVGVVSNHGNWFTSEEHNKELRVLAQSYDWLIFLTDEGLAEFITELLLEPEPLLEPAKRAFLASYFAEKTKNQFTKVQMDYRADLVLQKYFKDNASRIETWFNVIAPQAVTMKTLESELSQLRDKNWRQIHSL